MTLAELRDRLERRISDAEEMQASAPVAEVLRLVVRELAGIGVSPSNQQVLSTQEAALLLGVKPKTVANWAAEGRLSGAKKTSGREGKWVIPAESLDIAAKKPRTRLWCQ